MKKAKIKLTHKIKSFYIRNSFGEIAKRSNATDCKSVGQVPSEVRILLSPLKPRVFYLGFFFDWPLQVSSIKKIDFTGFMA